MNIQITDKLGLPPGKVIQLVSSLLVNRKPVEGSFDYGFESHGVFLEFGIGVEVDIPIQCYQVGKRKKDNSPIKIIIEKHTAIK